METQDRLKDMVTDLCAIAYEQGSIDLLNKVGEELARLIQTHFLAKRTIPDGLMRKMAVADEVPVVLAGLSGFMQTQIDEAKLRIATLSLPHQAASAEEAPHGRL